MTEKRFTFADGFKIVAIRDNGEIMNSKEVCEKLNELYDENKELKELVSEVDNELEIRDIVCISGKFRLEEWGKHRYHQFYKGDEELEDESVVMMLMELEKENKELKEENQQLRELLEYGLEVSQVEIDEELRRIKNE